MSTSAKSTRAALSTTRDPRWAAIVARDAGADGSFYYSVKTTGVYCRPSCASRTALPQNVRFHKTRKEAEEAGFRPCKRCKPDQAPPAQRHATTIAEACRFIEKSDAVPNLVQLAKHAGISPYHFHRLFKKTTGVTPREYATAHRDRRVRGALRRDKDITRAIFNAGYSSSSRFYERAHEILGMTPTAYRAGGNRSSIRFAVGECSLGSILVAQSERGICAILLGDDPGALVKDLQDRFPRADLIGGDRKFESVVAKVIGIVDAPKHALGLPLDIRGTAFQRQVWQALRKIPAGKTASYAEIAAKIGSPKAVRAVAQACAANHLAVVIPCHRVVRHDGNLSGYRWGVERKRALLKKESKTDR
jgi:AraC family transcriptional regulator of adaptative response/methylated-DNA-[protein]-cysteine methyltransferase